MGRWLVLACSVLVLSAVTHLQSVRSPTAVALSGACVTDRDCQNDLSCTFQPGVMEGQCAASCNASESCQERFGTESVCLGADLCARTCELQADCPSGAVCNLYGWCER